MNIENTVLENGLNTLLIDSPNSNVTTAQIWFKAGSSLEQKSNMGIAHFLEHMFFKGSKKYPNMKIAKTIESFGGEINAFTSFDYTCYYINGPANESEKIIDVLLDMVSNPLFLEEDLIPERGVVFEEYRRSIDNPSQYNFFKIQDAAFPKSYRHPILGTEKNIKNFSIDQLTAFRNDFYNRENSLLIVAGNFKSKEKVKKLINQYQLPSGKKSNFSKFKLVSKPSITLHNKAVNQVTVTLNIQAPDYTHNDSPAEDLAVNSLCYGDISPFYKDLIGKSNLANGVSGSTMFFSKGGCHFIRFACPLENFKEVLKEFPKTLENVLKNGLTQDAIDRIRNQYIASKIYEKETLESYAFALGHGFAQSGDIYCEDEFIKKMKNISKSKVLKSIAEIFERDMHICVQLPNNTEENDYKKDIENFRTQVNQVAKTSLASSEIKDIETSKYDSEVKTIKLSKKIKLLYRYNPLTPTFAFHSYIKGGLSHETPEINGVYNLIAKNLTYGHKKAKYEELKNELEKKSSYINGFSGRNAYGMTLHGLSEHSGSLINHFMSLLINPVMPANYFNTEKELIKRTLFLQKEDPVKHCFRAFSDMVFNSHPYSMDIIGNEKSIKKITRKTLLETHQKQLTESEIVFTFCGDLELETVLEMLAPHLNLLSQTKKVQKHKKKKVKVLKNQAKIIDFDREQTHIMIGKPSFSVGSDEDLYLKMFTTYLSGQSSELFLEVRDKKGLCYSVQPLQNTSLEAGYWGIYIGAGHDKVDAAIKAIKDILEKYRKKGFSKKDFNQIKKMINGQNLINLQTNEDYANFYSISVLHELGLDFQHHGFEKINSMKLEDFNKFLSTFLIDDWNMVQVGRQE